MKRVAMIVTVACALVASPTSEVSAGSVMAPRAARHGDCTGVSTWQLRVVTLATSELRVRFLVIGGEEGQDVERLPRPRRGGVLRGITQTRASAAWSASGNASRTSRARRSSGRRATTWSRVRSAVDASRHASPRDPFALAADRS